MSYSVSGTITLSPDPSGGGTVDTEKAREDAVTVTMMRPSKLKWKLGSFGTFTPSERIYAKAVNLIRLGSNTDNYTGQFSSDPSLPAVFASGSNLVAHNSSASLCYATETDVAAVSNPTRTLSKMRAWLLRDSSPTNYQSQIVSTQKAGSTLTTITPGTYGSIVMDLEGQGFELDLIASASGGTYFPAYSTFIAMTADGVNNQWAHSRSYFKLMMPIASTMDGASFTWSVQAWSSFSQYAGFVNSRVVNLPDWWNTDVT